VIVKNNNAGQTIAPYIDIAISSLLRDRHGNIDFITGKEIIKPIIYNVINIYIFFNY
jgi:hypothetical protein